MLNYKKTNLPKSTFQFDLVIQKDEVKKTCDQAFSDIAQEVEIPGFRKGKAPREIVQKQIKKETVINQALQKLLPQIYEELIKEINLKPITQPKIELLKAEENEDWQIRITVAEKPTVNLKNYQEFIKNALAAEKKSEIWTPDNTNPKAESKTENQEEKQKKLLQIVFNTLLNNIQIDVPDLLIESELQKKLTQLVDDVRKIGLTIEAYLKSKNETIDSLKTRFKKEIEEMYILELALEEIAENANIVVNEADLESLFAHIKNEKDRQSARQNSYFYASLVRRQKTLDYLIGL